VKEATVVVDARTWMEVLSPSECWELLDKTALGRVAVMADGRPEIYPVNYATDRHTVLFRTEKGSKLRAILQQPEVCFEIDGTGHELWSGWSVMLKGRAHEVMTGEEASRVGSLELRCWAWGQKPHWVRIIHEQVSGRRIHRPGNENVVRHRGPSWMR
jgi:nitroimidazol reductase NimA-like FMN-containing flavoprotein (pyridoxamine 5'-phosphate oxidase superfamily)